MEAESAGRFAWGFILRSKLSTVKQFTAAFSLLLLLLLGGSTAHSQEECRRVFSPSKNVSDIDDQAISKMYYRYHHQFGTKTPKTITVETLGKKHEVKTPESLKGKFNPQKNIDVAFLGLLGKIFDLKFDPETKKNIYTVNAEYFKESRAKSKELLQRAEPALSPEFLMLMQSNLHFEALTKETTFVQFSNMNQNRPQDEVSIAIRNRFLVMYIHMANWVYRSSGLEKNKALSSATMIDEMVSITKEMKAFDFQFVFDSKVWSAQLSILQGLIKDYETSLDPKMKKEILEWISQPRDPLLPFAGVAVTKSILNPHSPVEFKRYFKNDLEDPMALVELTKETTKETTKKDEFYLRHKMLYRIIERLPEHTELEIHAHSLVHARAYLKLGFKNTGIIENPKYPGVQVHLLKAQREETLEKIAAILHKTQ